VASLFSYMQDLQTLMADAKQELLDPQDLVRFINIGRREVAMRAQCIRVLPPTSGSIQQITVTNPGSGYTNPTVTISYPDYPSGLLPYPNGLQATATAELFLGGISTINITNGGSGYYQPIVTITDPTGSGAETSIVLTYINQVSQGQEVYPFSGVDLSMFPGVGEIFMVKSVSLVYANYRYSLPFYDFSTYQARIRQYPFQYQYVPVIFSQFGQGASGSLYMYPLPSQSYQAEWDCFCWPQDLEDDQGVEAIPDPWTEAVPYMAAYRAYLSLQNHNSARNMLALFDQFVTRYGTYSRPGRMTNPYGRY